MSRAQPADWRSLPIAIIDHIVERGLFRSGVCERLANTALCL
jgi:hypothetical protein